MAQDDKIKAKRDRDFQAKLLEALDSLKPPSTSVFVRLLHVANSPLFLVVVGLFVSFLVFYRQTYVQCVADSRKLYSDYVGLDTELLYRKNEIVSIVLDVRSIAELKQKLDPKKYFGTQYKDNALTDLVTKHALESQLIDESGINKSAETALQQNETYQKFSAVFAYGIVPATLKDGDLAELKQIALAVGTVDMMKFITLIRTEAEIQCIRPNILMLMWGETPVTLQRYDVGSFSKKETLRLRAIKGRNFLTPKTAPAPFPETDFKPPATPVEPPTK
jgi:hypothetical protein